MHNTLAPIDIPTVLVQRFPWLASQHGRKWIDEHIALMPENASAATQDAFVVRLIELADAAEWAMTCFNN